MKIKIAEKEVRVEIPGMCITIESKMPARIEVAENLTENDSPHRGIVLRPVKLKKAGNDKKPGGDQNRVARSKTCIGCNGEFAPTTNAQKYCNAACKLLYKQKQLDDTLKEIGDRQKEPYEFAKRI